MEKIKEIFSKFEIKKGWQWLIYINLILPAILFLVAYLANGNSLGITFATLFHTYNLFILNPIPNFQSLTGIVGLIIPVYFAIKAVQAKDYLDLALVVVILVLTWVYMLTETNYLLIQYLGFN